MSFGSFLSATFSFLITVIAFLIPAYNSHKALEAHNGLETWLTYWVVLGLVNTLEHALYYIFHRLPLISLIKLAFFIWLQLPQTKGAQTIYIQCVLPLLKQHASQIDQYLEVGKQTVTKQMTQLGFLRAEDIHAAPSVGLSNAVSRFPTHTSLSSSAYQDVENPVSDATKAS